MYVETHYTGQSDEYVDRIVATNELEDMRLEAIFMVGAGVNCGRTATDRSDPLQISFPRTYSVETTEIIVKGLYKAKDGPRAGYLGMIGPRSAQAMLARTVLDRQSVVPLIDIDLDWADLREDYWANYGQHNNAN